MVNQKNFSVFIRADATPKMGTGHVMRCLALAAAVTDAGGSVCFSGHINVPWLLTRIEQEKVCFNLLEGSPALQENAENLLGQIPESCSWVVLDGYHFDLECQKAILNSGKKLLVIDDYGHLFEYSCTVLLNQNITAEHIVYQGVIEKKLCGLNYALLRSEFSRARLAAEQRVFEDGIRRVLISLGGGDFSSCLTKISNELKLLKLPAYSVQIIAGSMPPEKIKEIFSWHEGKLEILQRVANMPEVMLQTDLCISAGGSTCWELCCLGIPFLTIEVAENQHALIDELSAKGLADVFSSGTFLEAAKSLPYRKERKAALMGYVDGHGAARVVSLMQEQMFFLRPVSSKDSESVWKLAGSEDVRSASCSQKPIPWEAHKLWFEQQLSKNSSYFFIVSGLDSSFLGYVRFSFEENNEAFVSIALIQEMRSKNIGTAVLGQACARFRTMFAQHLVNALVHEDNIGSQKIFLKNSFEAKGVIVVNNRRFIKYTLSWK